MNELQSTLLDMLQFFHETCVNHHIRYYLIEGSFLGAYRHKGFIPWDDDIDIGVPRADYDRLIALMKNCRHEKYIFESPLENPDFPYSLSKLYDTSTTLVENLRYPVRRGVYLDIFPLDGAGNTKEEAIRHSKKVILYDSYIRTKNCAISAHRKFYKNAAIILGRCVPEFLYSWRKALKKAEALCRSKSFYDCKYVCNMYSTWREKEIMEASVYGEPVLYDFEGLRIYGPQNADRYLSNLYGDYMCLPPEEKRVSHHAYSHLDLTTPYKQIH